MSINPSSPVLVDLSTFVLDTRYRDPWTSDFTRCLGFAARRKDACDQHISKIRAKNATRLMNDFSKLQQCPHDEEFYKHVDEFLSSTHCYAHLPDVRSKFLKWKAGSHTSLQEQVELAETKTGPMQTPTMDSISVEASPRQISGCSSSTSVDGSTPSQSQNTATTLDFSESTADFSSLSVTSDPKPTVFGIQKSDGTAKTISEPVPTKHDYNPPPPLRERGPKGPISNESEPSDEEINLMVAELESDEKDLETLERSKQRLTINRSKSKLVHYIHRPFNQDDRRTGVVYVLRHVKNEEIITVGFSREHTNKDGLPQSESCYAKDSEMVYQSQEKFFGAFRVTNLVKAALKESRHLISDCAHCGMTHEWFRVTRAKMIEAVDTWTAFVRSSAYSDGKLSEAGHLMTDVLVDLSSARVAVVLNEFGAVAEKTERDPAESQAKTTSPAIIPQNFEPRELPIRRKPVNGIAADKGSLSDIGEDHPSLHDSDKINLNSQNSQPPLKSPTEITERRRTSIGKACRKTAETVVKRAKTAKAAVKTAAGSTMTYFRRRSSSEEFATDVKSLGQELATIFNKVSLQFNDKMDQTHPSTWSPKSRDKTK
ncbi:hypothetical protein AUP68_03870 [Ilyonectria robusta]